ncbi:VapE domain-containing protein [Pseudanabaena sp. 'Roaring Creek']|uniref:VapE domain-containing protein n=1 Tax=Pseudanabaena sp. 'Roaring Creek' TaxID=1681830 RepID=UPI0006D8522B|nr:VapE domain-containing protein [Pseudanabaena sp. 'Roaring Creek']
MSNEDYCLTSDIITSDFSNRLSFNTSTRDIYLDTQIFEVARLRSEVMQKKNRLLKNDKYIYEIALQEAEKHCFSPVKDYLDKCAKRHKKVDYLEVFRDLNTNALHIDSDSLEAKYVAMTLVGAVKRVYELGSQHDTVLILKGKQGFFKTSFFRELASINWFTTINLINYNADELMVCHSKWLIELGECEETIKPHAMGKLKAFITKTVDSYRKPYAKNPIDIPRQFILVGSTNRDKFLVDTTGNRRFWVTEIHQKIDINWVRTNRDLIWAAAFKAYKNNFSTYLDDDEQNKSDSLNNSKNLLEDMWKEKISEWTLSQTTPFTLGDVLTKCLNIPAKTWKRSDEARVTSILDTLGFPKPKTSTRVDGKSGKYFLPMKDLSYVTN